MDGTPRPERPNAALLSGMPRSIVQCFTDMRIWALITSYGISPLLCCLRTAAKHATPTSTLDYRAVSQLCAALETPQPPIALWRSGRGAGSAGGDKHPNGLNSTTTNGYASKANQLLSCKATESQIPSRPTIHPLMRRQMSGL